MKQLEPELKEIKEKFKKDKQEQAKKIMELYKEHGINPLSGFITLLIQIPIIIALYKVFLSGVKFDSSHLYSFITPPDYVNIKFLGFFDMTQKSYILAGLAGLSQFVQMKLAMPIVKKIQGAARSFQDDFARSMSIQARYVMPLLIFFIALKFVSAIALYWTTMNIFAILHEALVRKKAEKILKNGANKNNKIAFGNDSGKINH
jgi:YidC/Oxa1 family membrane protein insertase